MVWVHWVWLAGVFASSPGKPLPKRTINRDSLLLSLFSSPPQRLVPTSSSMLRKERKRGWGGRVCPRGPRVKGKRRKRRRALTLVGDKRRNWSDVHPQLLRTVQTHHRKGPSRAEAAKEEGGRKGGGRRKSIHPALTAKWGVGVGMKIPGGEGSAVHSCLCSRSLFFPRLPQQDREKRRMNG